MVMVRAVTREGMAVADLAEVATGSTIQEVKVTAGGAMVTDTGTETEIEVLRAGMKPGATADTSRTG